MTPADAVRWLGAWRGAVLLGFATIGAYGLVQYAIGVLVPAISADTGWSTGTLALAFSVGVLLSGPAAVAAGYALDRAGSRPVLLGALAAGGTLLAAASWASGPAAFVVLWGLG
ncbi:MAG: MFS transporter, partial [Chloroflexi bacterium]|nr:MFS transporter [Chloroflexota bacterium]